MTDTTYIPNLLEYYLTEFAYKERDTGDAEEHVAKTVKLNYNVNINTENEKIYKMVLSIALNDSSGQDDWNFFESKITGIFIFSDEAEDAHKRDVMIRLQGCTTLYGIMRGMIGLFTSSTVFGKEILPNIIVQDVVKRIEEAKKKVEQEEASIESSS